MRPPVFHSFLGASLEIPEEEQVGWGTWGTGSVAWGPHRGLSPEFRPLKGTFVFSYFAMSEEEK